VPVFAQEGGASFEYEGDVLHDLPVSRVRGRFVENEMPCLAFAIEESARRVARDRLSALGETTGAWLREGEQEMTRSVGELARC
jgi:ribonuclease Z